METPFHDSMYWYFSCLRMSNSMVFDRFVHPVECIDMMTRMRETRQGNNKISPMLMGSCRVSLLSNQERKPALKKPKRRQQSIICSFWGFVSGWVERVAAYNAYVYVNIETPTLNVPCFAFPCSRVEGQELQGKEHSESSNSINPSANTTQADAAFIWNLWFREKPKEARRRRA